MVICLNKKVNVRLTLVRNTRKQPAKINIVWKQVTPMSIHTMIMAARMDTNGIQIIVR